MPILQTKDYKEFTIVDDTNNYEPIVSFSDYKKANKCLPGDEVEWKDEKCLLKKRALYGPIIGILEMTSKYIYGHTARGNKIYLFHPFNPAFPVMRVGTSEKDTSVNRIALVEYADWEPHEHILRGNLIRFLGPAGQHSVELEALRWLYAKPQLSKINFDIDVDSIYKKNSSRERIEGFTINIDPDGCKDIDDVITITQKSDNEWMLIITISDVAEFIEEGSPGDILAMEKGQTLYQNGKAVLPMLPASLSENSLSLLPGEERLGVSLYCTWNSENKTLLINGFKETILQNNATYTYDTIQDSSEFLVKTLLKDVASYLKGSETSDSHEWIEELMLLYNKESAKLLLTQNYGLLRKHKEGDKERFDRFSAIHPDLTTLAFESATYEPTKDGIYHYALGSMAYTHASSPLRRYADLVNQRYMKAILRKNIVDDTINKMKELANSLNTIQKKYKKHDRQLFFLEQMFSSPIGKQVGIVVEELKNKTKVYVSQWKRIISVKKQLDSLDTWKEGESVEVQYYSEMRQPRWSERMVFRLKELNTGYQALQDRAQDVHVG